MTLRHALPAFLLSCLLGSVAQQATASSPYHPGLADSPWPQFHQGPWQQGSTPSPGPVAAARLGGAQFVDTGLVNVGLLMSPKYPDGNRAYWGGSIDKVYKLAVIGGKLQKVSTVDRYGAPQTNVKSPFAGAYTALLHDNTYLTGSSRTLLAYRDDRNNIHSPITLHKSYQIPYAAVPDPDSSTADHITGLAVLWDGRIAVVTRYGYVGVVDLENGRSYFRKVDLDPNGVRQRISNSIAVDMEAGIYVVSNREMYRFQWQQGPTWETSSLQSPLDGNGSCASCWRYTYEYAPPAAGTLGDGSGSTPSIMGDNGEYVVITDGAKVANLTVLRTGILAPNQSRLVARIPVTFGNPDRARTASEQSVLVSGYGMLVVSNDYRNVTDGKSIVNSLPWYLAFLKPLLNELLDLPVMQNIEDAAVTVVGYLPKHQPWGVQKFTLDPVTGTLRSAWHRTDVSCPNSVPTMSEAVQRFYCVGAKDYAWTIESLDWNTGASHFRKDVGLLPRFNSFYAATQLTPDGGVLYGSIRGAVYLPRQ